METQNGIENQMTWTPIAKAFLFTLTLAMAGGAATAPAAGTVITSVSHRGHEATARGETPAGVRPGSLAAAVDSQGHVLGILRFVFRSGPKLRLKVVEPLWPGSVRRGLELRWFDTTGGHGPVVWTEAWGAPLSVDGRQVARLPALLTITHGTHTLLTSLPGGITAGGRLASPVSRDFVCLRGIGWPLGDEPSMKLMHRPSPDPAALLTWVEIPEHGRFYHPGGPVTAPEKLKTVAPEYPSRLRQAHMQGWATFLVLVAPDGSVKAVVRTARSDEAFAAVGTRALRRWTFKPAMLDGRPVGSTFRMTLSWTLTR